MREMSELVSVIFAGVGLLVCAFIIGIVSPELILVMLALHAADWCRKYLNRRATQGTCALT